MLATTVGAVPVMFIVSVVLASTTLAPVPSVIR